MDINPIFQSAQRLFSRIQDSGGKKVGHMLDTTLPISDFEHEFDSPYPMPSEVTKRYIIRRPLGKGGFGIVCLAEDRKIGRLVAIKHLANYRRRDPEIYERFMQEARIGAQLDHPNLVNVLALEEDENSACIIMEYLGGGSLASYLVKERKVDVQTAVRITLGVLNGLDAAHHIMVIHRDIKPQNILFGPHGEPKISDFGVAHLPVISGGIPEEQGTYQNKVIGTPLYMAPEQISNNPYDHRVDLYAVGAVLYEMLTGKKIFTPRGDITLDTMRNLIMTIEPDPIDTDTGIPKGLADITMRLLAKKPKDRFPDARSTIIALGEISLPVSGKKRDIEPETRIGASGPLISSPAAMLEDVIRLFLIDGSISPAERRELARRAERLGVSSPHARGIENKIRMELGYPSIEAVEEYTDLMREFMSSSPEMRISAANRERLDRRREELRISHEEAVSLEKELYDKIKYQRLAENKNSA